MPHKHKRKRENDSSIYDLPPSSRAKTLSVHKKADPIFTSDIEKKRKYEARRQSKEHKRDQKKNLRTGQDYKDDDTPKAFKRMMLFQEGKRPRSGLDDGTKSASKKRKRTNPEGDAAPKTSAPAPAPTSTSEPPDAAVPTQASGSDTLKIRPTESLATFAQRVDQSLPLSSIPKHNHKAGVAGLEKLKPALTKHNKRLARMQKEWRNADQKLKDKQVELEDEMLERKEEDEVLWLGAGVDPSAPNGSSRKKRRRGGAGKDVDDADPWKVLEKKRREEGELRQKNLQDVVQAPPVLKPIKNIFKEHPVQRARVGQTNISRAIMT